MNRNLLLKICGITALAIPGLFLLLLLAVGVFAAMVQHWPWAESFMPFAIGCAVLVVPLNFIRATQKVHFKQQRYERQVLDMPDLPPPEYKATMGLWLGGVLTIILCSIGLISSLVMPFMSWGPAEIGDFWVMWPPLLISSLAAFIYSVAHMTSN